MITYLTLVFVLFYIISLESIGLMKREKKKHARRCQLSHLFLGEQHMVNVSISSA